MMGRNRNAGKPGAKNPGKTFKRIFAEIMSKYKVHCIAVVICLLISAVANVYGTMFMQRLIDDYITPMMGQPNPDFGPMGRAVLGVAAVYPRRVQRVAVQLSDDLRLAGHAEKSARQALFQDGAPADQVF